MALTIVVLLTVWYVGAWICWPRAWFHIYYRVPPSVLAAVDCFFDPLLWYTRSGYPGGEALSELWWAANSDIYDVGPVGVQGWSVEYDE